MGGGGGRAEGAAGRAGVHGCGCRSTTGKSRGAGKRWGSRGRGAGVESGPPGGEGGRARYHLMPATGSSGIMAGGGTRSFQRELGCTGCGRERGSGPRIPGRGRTGAGGAAEPGQGRGHDRGDRRRRGDDHTDPGAAGGQGPAGRRGPGGCGLPGVELIVHAAGVGGMTVVCGVGLGNSAHGGAGRGMRRARWRLTSTHAQASRSHGIVSSARSQYRQNRHDVTSWRS